ncbi:5769_t:CDS:1 [Ambispora gerdemannii]|uniref:5769_t:CDS:1 n=1 Tax=Ambispora gerdemannii TaxID=144530 RepID=A0A9N9DNY8_9GLOM|nr:5769_t:CDS:1 [Ambispora gerdemannii]
MVKTRKSTPSIVKEKRKQHVASREEVIEFRKIYKITPPPYAISELIKDMQKEFISSNGHIKRPPNPFLVFRKTANKRAKEFGLKCKEQNKFQTRFSELLGRVWQALPREEKDGYYKLAEEIKIEHKKEFPNYEFHPKRDRSIFRIYNHTQKDVADIDESSSDSSIDQDLNPQDFVTYYMIFDS